MPPERLKILTWHVHGNYLYYLSQAPHDFYVLSKPGRPPGYAGVTGRLPWGDNVHDLPCEAVSDRDFDCILYQSRAHFVADRHLLLTRSQKALPQVYLEHDPPQPHPTDTRHPAAGAVDLIVHVTRYNALMWDGGGTPTRVIEHGVHLPGAPAWTGERPEGVVVVNHLARRGRRLGADVFREMRRRVPLALIGMDAGALGGFGEVPNPELPALLARYRFFFNPARYTSLALSLVEAMTVGLPVLALSVTEQPSVIENGVNGFCSNDLDALADAMRRLIADPALAARWGARAREAALARFGIARFAADWDAALRSVAAPRLRRPAGGGAAHAPRPRTGPAGYRASSG